MAANKTYPCLTADEAAVLIPNGAMVAVSGFTPACIASFEGKIITDDHPAQFLDPNNTTAYQRGHVQHVRVGSPLPDGAIPLLGDLLITDSLLIEKILAGGKREVSAGYTSEYTENEDGSLTQRQIRGNHIAVVGAGRAGHAVAIRDGDARDDFAAAARRFHRRNILDVPRVASAVNWPTRLAITDNNNSEGEMKKQENWDEINKRLDVVIDLLEAWQRRSKDSAQRRTLRDETSELIRSSQGVERLTAEGVGPVRFHEQLARLNQAYREYSMRDDADQAFADEANAMGARMRNESFESTLKRYRGNPSRSRTKVNDEGEDWASTVNQLGREMRKK